MSSTMDHDPEVKMEENNSNRISHKLFKFSKHGFQSFCESTTMHGYFEMYKTKSTYWVVFWLAIITGSVAVTGYQVFQAIDQYTNQITITTIEPVSSSTVIYPPLKLCSGHFIYWVDWTKVEEENITQEIILQSLSYLTSVYSKKRFNMTQVDKQFKAEMMKRNFTTLHQFYKFIAQPVDNLFGIDNMFYELKSYDIEDLFAAAEPTFSSYSGFQLCYTASSENLKQFFTVAKKAKYEATLDKEMRNQLTLIGGLQFSGLENYKKYVNPEEYAKYIENWANNLFNVIPSFEPKNYSQYTIPDEIYIDGFNSKPIVCSNHVPEYEIYVKASAHKYERLSKVFPCEHSVEYIASNMTCKQICRAVDQMETIEKYAHIIPGNSEIENCMSLKFYIIAQPENYIDRVCKYDIEFIYPEQEIMEIPSKDQQKTKPVLVYFVDIPAVNETEEQMINQIKRERETKLKECSSRCLPGCEKWNFDYTVSARSFGPIMNLFDQSINYYKLKIEYPSDGDILMMTEINSQSWESFVGNVGGLLGIWTGASILSLIQMFYLCFCDESTCECCAWKNRRPSMRSTPKVSAEGVKCRKRDSS